ncbi:MAG: hypothetical protein IK130_03555 [Oscillospiraceae bacterium]|nr:hypothetical protein [Oscillospiraceae bacterium]
MAIQYSETEYRNFGKCICLENGKIRLMVTLDIGPRIIYFSTRGGSNILFEDVNRDFCELNKGYGTWYAYGGHRLWCAPEMMPETYFPDNNRVSYEFKDGILTLNAKPTPFGKQFSLQIEMSDGNSVKIRNIITNTSEKPAFFAPWALTGLASGGIEFIPLSRKQTGFLPNRTMALWSYSQIADPRFTLKDECAVLRHDQQASAPFKAGFNVADGYVVYAAGNQVFRKSFEPYGDCSYPDFGCNFETYTNKLFLEIELLGALREYAAGEQAVIEETWEICETNQSPEEVIAAQMKQITGS